MITFRNVQSNEDLTKYKDWKSVPPNNYPLLNVILNEEGKVVSSFYKGRAYYFIAKFEKERGIIARIIRILAGIMLGLTILPLFSSRVRNLFSAKEVIVLRELRKVKDVGPNLLLCPLKKIKLFKIEPSRLNDQYKCWIGADPNATIDFLRYAGEFLDVEIKDMLDLIPRSIVKYDGNLDHFAKLQYLSV